MRNICHNCEEYCDIKQLNYLICKQLPIISISGCRNLYQFYQFYILTNLPTKYKTQVNHCLLENQETEFMPRTFIKRFSKAHLNTTYRVPMG